MKTTDSLEQLLTGYVELYPSITDK
jgi:hypothetical protein